MLKNYDKVLLGLVFLLLIFGVIVLTSASSIVALSQQGTAYHFLNRQLLMGIIPGLAALLLLANISYQWLKKISWPFFIISLLLSFLVLVPGLGISRGGARRWLGLGSFSFQPTELLKLAFILLLAALLTKQPSLIVFLPLVLLTAIPIALQSDLGTLVLFVLIAAAIFFVSGASWPNLLTSSVLGGLAVVLLIKLAPYRLTRLLTFLNPQIDPQGAGYQINQALLALGSGGLLGLGLGQSRQKYAYLPAVINDSIFAVIGEELGLIGALGLVILLLILAWRGLWLAGRSTDQFGRLLVVGITAWIIFQAFINIAGIINLIPLTGMPLPFVSYGPTAMVALLAGVGILLNVSKHIRQ